MTEGRNPWLSGPPQAPESPVQVQAPATRPTGPQAPQAGVPAPDRDDLLPVIGQAKPADLWLLGAHGGAGESSLAALVDGWQAAQHGWPQLPGNETAEVVLVARSNLRGLRAAQAAATQWASGLVSCVHLLGLVIVADAPGRLPRPLRDYARIVAGGVPRTWNVPWIESWRLGEDPELPDAPHAVRRLVDDVRELTRPGAAGTTNRKDAR